MITNIIESLTTQGSLTNPLLKTLAFARRIGNTELANWVSKELNGYDSNEELPNYRYTKTVVQGVMQQGGRRTGEVSLPLSCFSEEYSKYLMKKGFYESVATLDDLSSHGDQYLSKEFAADLCHQLNLQAQSNGCDFKVISCRQLVALYEVRGIVTAVRTKLLELLLKIEIDFPEANEQNATLKSKEQINNTINYMMSNVYNINSTGDGNVVNTGNKNQINLNNTFEKGNLKALQDSFASNGVSQNDIDEISEIVMEEQPVNESLGQRAKAWTTKMLGKAMDETWKVSLGVGAKLLEEGLKHYYGLK